MNKSIYFGEYPFQRTSHIRIFKNEGMWNDVEKALSHYYNIFGVTEALENLQSVSFKNGHYEFFFIKDSSSMIHNWHQLVQFVLVLDWEVAYGCDVRVGNEYFECRKGSHSKQRIPPFSFHAGDEKIFI